MWINILNFTVEKLLIAHTKNVFFSYKILLDIIKNKHSRIENKLGLK